VRHRFFNALTSWSLWHQTAWVVHKAEAVEDHRFDGIARDHDPRRWIVSGGSVNDFTNAEFIEHTCDKAQMVEGLTAVGLWHDVLLSQGASYRPLNMNQHAWGTAECRQEI
jgi:hypothetical protein